MALSVELVPFKHGDQGWVPRTHVKKPSIMVGTCDPNTGEVETDRPCPGGSAVSQPQVPVRGYVPQNRCTALKEQHSNTQGCPPASTNTPTLSHKIQ